MVGWPHRLNGHEFEQTPGNSEGQGRLVCCSPWGHNEQDTTERLSLSEEVSILFFCCRIYDLGLLFFAQSCPTLATQWTTARQASLSFTISQNLLKFMSFELMMPSNHLILYCPLLLLFSIFPSNRVFSNESVSFASCGQSIGASASDLPMNIQAWFPLELISLQSKRLSTVFSNTTV